MRVVFMGTPAFAVPSLQALAETHEVALVVTRRDAARGRGSGARPSAVKEAAVALGIPVLQPERLDDAANAAIASVAPEVICVAAFGMLLPPATLAIAPHGCLNVHASLLPRHRGAAPIQRAILGGDTVTGVSIMRMEEGLDTGPYSRQREVPIGDRYAAEVEADVAMAGAEELVATLDDLSRDDAVFVTQDESCVTYAAKVTKDDVALLPELPVADAFRRVRASTRSAPARACLGDREVTVVHARPVVADVVGGSVCAVEGVPVLGFADGALALDVVRPAGKGDMSGADWARGARLGDDVCWRCTR